MAEMKWYEESDEVQSAMRILAMIGGLVGLIIALAGAVAMFLGSPIAAAMAGIGAGIFALALGGKVAQKGFENQIDGELPEEKDD